MGSTSPESEQEVSESDESTRDDVTESVQESRTRNRERSVMYLSGDLHDELNRTFERFNAKRTIDDKDQIEKHKHFLEGLVRAGLESDQLTDYIMAEYDS